ncbi:hypothetical protein [Oryza sativa Japonica Group]|uniref:Uncharacterized protein P0702H08.2 n=1 Tax=Oryza sativa subsp. japonica TaxID=39947 RepID=Q8LQT9_ORYSJ|nr:hypothetical protein [Oryza sativa Japonica Group]
MSSSLLSGAEVREGSEEGSPLSEMEECGCQWEEGGDSVGVVVRGRGRGGVTLVRGGMRVATVTEEKEQRVHGAVHKGEGV